MNLLRNIISAALLFLSMGVAAAPHLLYSKASLKSDGDKIYNVYSRQGKEISDGFTIVSGDHRLPGVLATAEKGEFNPESLPSSLRAYLDAYERFVATASDTEIENVAAMRASLDIYKEVAPLMNTKWGQAAPYNNMCPLLPSGERTVTGCEATAMAQVLYYHKYPSELLEDIPAYTTSTNGLRLDAISAGEKYDWDNILPVYNGTSTVEQDAAVAKLMLHVGCSLMMDYGLESGTRASVDALTQCFGMDKELTRYESRYDYDMAQWNEMLYKEMAEGRPVIYEGRTTYGAGHAFVIDGYKDGAYHVNWGWDGFSDGYFDICFLMGFGLDNYMVKGLQPDNGVVDTPDEEASVGLLRCGSLNPNALTEITVADGVLTGRAKFNITNGSDNAVKRKVSIGYILTDGSIVNAATPFTMNVTANSSKKCIIKLSFTVEEGATYELVGIESEDGETWLPCRQEQVDGSVAVAIKNGEAECLPASPVLTASMGLSPENKENTGPGIYNIVANIANSGYKDYYNVISFKIMPQGSESGMYAYVAGVTVPRDGEITLSFSYEITTSEIYDFVAYDSKDVEIGRTSIPFMTGENYRRYKNQAAYEADIKAIAEIQSLLDMTVSEIMKEFPEFDVQSAKAPIQQSIDDMKKAADELYDSVESEGIYHSVYDGTAVEDMIEEMLKSAEMSGIDSITIDGNEIVAIYNLQGIKVAQPVEGQINIVVFRNGQRKLIRY